MSTRRCLQIQECGSAVGRVIGAAAAVLQGRCSRWESPAAAPIMEPPLTVACPPSLVPNALPGAQHRCGIRMMRIQAWCGVLPDLRSRVPGGRQDAVA